MGIDQFLEQFAGQDHNLQRTVRQTPKLVVIFLLKNTEL
jgi:hypothetical protein